MAKPLYTLKDYRVDPGSSFDRCIVGSIFGHPVLKDGRRVTTTKILWVSEHCAETWDAIYLLENNLTWV